ncbi:MAG TPA: SDR family oxidoreductase [Candidatus Binatia bacterium]|jgi:NAD(P)-dependent dehydrogenase (short-subunit alcohol dehydrogenase family)
MLLKDQVAIVSGIGPGLGQAIGLALAREGAAVVLAARGEDKLRDLEQAIRSKGGRAIAVATDISDPASCRNVVDKALSEFGAVDCLVNNAYHPGIYERIETIDLDTWRAPFEINVLGTLRLSQAVIPSMKERRSGSIVMINSMSMRRMMEMFGAYAASKAALNVATQTLALELGPYNIRVNSVMPGYIWGPPLKAYFDGEATRAGITPKEVYDAVAAQTALKTIPTSEEIAESVVFFASDMSRVITGQSLDVNAGHWFW